MILVRDIRDIAAHWRSGRAPAMDFRVVAPAGRSLPRPPLFVLGPPPAALLRDLAGAADPPAVGCYSLQDALVAPTGIAVKDGVAFHGDAFLHPRHLVVSISDRLNAGAAPVRRIDGELAVLYGPAHETYGHWLVDFLPRLWVLEQAGHDLRRLRYLVPRDMRDFGFALLRLCGIPADRLVIYDHWQELLRVEQLLLPTGLRLGDRLAPCFGEASTFWVARTGRPAQPRAPGAGGSLYLSRGGGERELVNRARIEAMAVSAGLAVMRPEDLPIAEQMAVFSQAGCIVGEYGSALHNSILAGAGARVCALRGTARHPSLVQSGLATALAQDVAYVFGATEGDGARQSFHVSEEDFALALTLLRLEAG